MKRFSSFFLFLTLAACSGPKDVHSIVSPETTNDASPPETADAGPSPLDGSAASDGGPQADADAGFDAAACVGEWDIPSESLAQDVCSHQGTGGDCTVCVQSYQGGAPSTWVAMFNCPCSAVDGGTK